MCGICGIYYYDRERTVDQRMLKGMARTMRHRGPDDEGFFISPPVGLGHQRLSIIDLSPSGRQPMSNENGRFWVVLNGEIYNYRDLRTELLGKGHRFRSQSDTEVILHLFEEEGPSCVGRLNGMFSFALWDKEEEILFAARDRFGIKPFYYFQNREAFAFASEIKPLFQTGLLAPRLNPDGLADYLALQFSLGSKTLFKDIFKLLPGHYLILKKSGSLDIRKYWDLDFTVDTHHTEEYFRDQLLALLEDSVRLQLRADVPVGSHLSGGIDSSTIACMAASMSANPIHTFSGGFKEGTNYDETVYARMVADHIGAQSHEIFPTSQDFVETLPKLIGYMEEPMAGPGLFPQYYVSLSASRHVKVVLGGQGGDEIFGGYIRYLIAYLEECIRGGIEGTQLDKKYVVTFESVLPNLVQLQGYQPLLRYFWKEGLFEPVENRYYRLIDRSHSFRHLVSPDAITGQNGYNPFEAYRGIFQQCESPSYINKMTRFDLKTLLPALLHVEDRMSMAVSLESRVPLLDHRIIELVASIPPMFKYKGGQSKYILRQAVQGLIPEKILLRKDKMGFPVPLNEWYGKEPLRSFVRDHLLGAQARSRSLFRSDNLESVLDHEQAYGRGIWGLLCLELWMQAFLDAPPCAPTHQV